MQSSACFPVSGGEVLNQLTKIRLPSGKEVGIVDWSYRPLYSTILTLNGWTDQELSWFTYSVGDQVSMSQNLIATAGGPFNATIQQTNISSASEMDSLEEYLCYALSVEVYEYGITGGAYAFGGAGTPSPNIPAMFMLNRLIVELEVSEKAYYQASLGFFATGFGPNFQLDSIAAIGAGRSYATNGLPSAEAIDVSPVPVHIGGTEKYRGILYNPGGTNGGNTINYNDDDGNPSATAVVELRLNMRGLHKRAAG